MRLLRLVPTYRTETHTWWELRRFFPAVRLFWFQRRVPAEFPKTLGLEEQGRFAIGYYHQRNEIFNKHAPDIQEGDTE